MTAPQPDPRLLVDLFADLFAASERTVLVRGAGEPLYRPWTPERPLAEVVFAHGFFSSALHEVAHWTIAGAARRELPDYGYWYKPDGRSSAEQREFEQVEVKPQAVEWIFSRAAGIAFHFSADNLGDGAVETPETWLAFQANVAAQARRYLADGLPPRAAAFAAGLSRLFETGDAWRDAAAYVPPR